MTDSDKVQHIRVLRLMTRDMDEWDEKYGRFADDSEVMTQIRRVCESQYPNVDIDSFLDSYAAFASGTKLNATINPKRCAFTERLRKGILQTQSDDDDPCFFVKVMRSLLGGEPVKGLSKPDAKYYDLLPGLDPAVVFLVYFPVSGGEFGKPLLEPFDCRPGNKVNDIDLYSLVPDMLKGALAKLYPKRVLNKSNPYLERSCAALSPVATGTTAKRLTIMDIVNLVYGVIDNIMVNMHSAALRNSNDSILSSRVEIELPERILWRTDRGEYCHIEAFADGYLITRFRREGGSRKKDRVFLSAFFDAGGQMVAYVEGVKAFRRLVDGEMLSEEDACYCTLRLYDAEGRLLIGVLSDEFRPARIVFDRYTGCSIQAASKILGFESLSLALKEKGDTVNFDDYVGNDKYASSCPDDDFVPTPLVWLLSDDYVYVQCEAAPSLEIPGAECVKSWYRFPRLSEFKTWLGDKVNLLSVRDNDVIALRTLNHGAALREFIIFSNLSLAVEVTGVKRPVPGYEFPGGVVIVSSPCQTLHAAGNGRFLTVDRAVFRPDADGRPKAEVTYLVFTADNVDHPERRTVVEDVVVPAK
ncbi:MAG: hypothetical protein ACI35Q_02715 [Marinilabiliaceae bacterium]